MAAWRALKPHAPACKAPCPAPLGMQERPARELTPSVPLRSWPPSLFLHPAGSFRKEFDLGALLNVPFGAGTIQVVNPQVSEPTPAWVAATRQLLALPLPLSLHSRMDARTFSPAV